MDIHELDFLTLSYDRNVSRVIDIHAPERTWTYQNSYFLLLSFVRRIRIITLNNAPYKFHEFKLKIGRSH